ncbi:MAG: Homoserine dehydrogenase [Hyphomicrobiaceae bacterium hypho_1]
MTKKLRLGIAGLGTVGVGLVNLLDARHEHLLRITGKSIVIQAVSARYKSKNRGIDISSIKWFDDPIALARNDEIDIFIELIGGDEGVARDSIMAALKSGKHVITANKALIAKHGNEMAALAEERNVALLFEASVAGGIPIINALREILLGNSINRIYGILNGTCNYILTKMQEERLPFWEVLKQAQDFGYAESDPTFDIGGHDTAHKLAILSSLAFGTEVTSNKIHIEGIQSITPEDIEAADALGYKIKLLGIAVKTKSGLEQRVHPTMISKNSSIAEVSGVTNCVAIDSEFAGNLTFVGPGAGADATASAVMSDIGNVARGFFSAPFLMPSRSLISDSKTKSSQHLSSYYVRLAIHDRPGAMAAIATRMAEQNVSLESIVQRRPQYQSPGKISTINSEENSHAYAVLVTYETSEKAMRDAMEAIEEDGVIAHPPQIIKIEHLH